MTTPSDHSRITDLLGRSLLGLAVVAVFVAPITAPSPVVAAVDTPTSRVRLIDITDARIARGGAPGTVGATATNPGLAPATAVTVRYQLPAGVEFVAERSTAGCSVAGTRVTCALGDLAPGASTRFAIGVAETSANAVLGSRVGYFLPPTTAQFDPEAGEVLMETWYHESGQEGTDLQLCWPVASPTPNMDVGGGTCDGTIDAAPLVADETTVLDAFPDPFSQSLVRSWQFETEITPPRAGTYQACGVLIDDGGYLLIAPADRTPTAADVVVSVPAYGTATSAPFTLEANTRYRVIMRVSNRGGDGIDNGADNNTLAGWDAYGIAPADEPCDVTSAAAFGTADTAFVPASSAFVGRTVADVIVVGTADLLVAGAIEAAPVDGVRSVSVRLANEGTDATGADVRFDLASGASLTGPVTGCDRAVTSPTLRCTLDAVAGTSGTGRRERVLGFSFISPTPGFSWAIETSTAVDVDPSNNHGPAPGTK